MVAISALHDIGNFLAVCDHIVLYLGIDGRLKTELADGCPPASCEQSPIDYGFGENVSTKVIAATAPDTSE